MCAFLFGVYYTLVHVYTIQNENSFCSAFHNTLQWRHNGRDSVSNHQPHDFLFNRLFRRRSKKTSKLRVTGLCAGIHRGPVNSPHKWPVTRKMFPFDDVIMIDTILLTRLGKGTWLPPANSVYAVERLIFPDSKVHGANTWPTWVLSDEPHVGPMNLAIRFCIEKSSCKHSKNTNRLVSV